MSGEIDLGNAQPKKPRPSDQELAKGVARRIEREIGNFRAPTPLTQIIREVVERSTNENDKFRKLVMWEDLGDNARKMGKNVPKHIIWTIRHYAGCMRYILRSRRMVMRDDNKERAAQGAHTINLLVNELCAPRPPHPPDPRRGLCVYTALSESNHSISEMNDKGPNRQENFSKLVASELEYKYLSLPKGAPIINPALLISQIWDEPYKRICNELSLTHFMNMHGSLDSEFGLFAVYAPGTVSVTGRGRTFLHAILEDSGSRVAFKS